MQSVGSVTLDLPPVTDWSTRTETLSVLGSTNGSNWTTLRRIDRLHVQPVDREHRLDQPAAGTSDQYLELDVTGNTGWDAAQVSEFETSQFRRRAVPAPRR